ncbi:hypothetical protein AGABI1DRAFT_70636 [Agaricus bisporus var. burnettii JB137-S8]|uniref:Core Histone H2A/H2B/H3 domain-containing protein n=1 Tax=Agaricus bisporus var. burnettii (strain JB137-S8 / ATCC MYA-4627 / FGSC 10392) TaxID=597362 RepID=K5Y2E0_AGABU|nr:uncharacterized protein AGABI1DRAFT_70636 [Agaricus bisporus var. burnettii JB137-S8]EKM82025.1 hypothetical protein AGABI1DRAFT_70636 [Agaricus bisporus var. burnettii JB137-S8]
MAHEVHHYQNTTNLLIPRVPFEELVRYIAYKVTEAPESHVRFTPQALQAIQEAAEYRLTQIFRHSCHSITIAKRKTLMPSDLWMGVHHRVDGEI